MKRLIRVGVREIQMSELEEWWSDTETEKHAEGRGEGAVDENCRRGGRERWSRVDGKSAGRRRRTLQWRSERIVAAQRIIWHVDPEYLDINQALGLCQRQKLYDADRKRVV